MAITTKETKGTEREKTIARIVWIARREREREREREKRREGERERSVIYEMDPVYFLNYQVLCDIFSLSLSHMWVTRHLFLTLLCAR